MPNMNRIHHSSGILDSIGILFLLVAVSAVINTIYQGNFYGIFWLCYTGLFLISLGILLRKDYLLMSQLNILLIPLFVWMVDFISFFIMGKTLFGITAYMFIPGHWLSKLIGLQHFFTIPLAIYALGRIGIRSRGSWKYSFIQLTSFFIFGRLFIPLEKNINYVFRWGMSDVFPSYFYPVLWFLSFFCVILISEMVIVKLIGKNHSKKSR